VGTRQELVQGSRESRRRIERGGDWSFIDVFSPPPSPIPPIHRMENTSEDSSPPLAWRTPAHSSSSSMAPWGSRTLSSTDSWERTCPSDRQVSVTTASMPRTVSDWPIETKSVPPLVLTISLQLRTLTRPRAESSDQYLLCSWSSGSEEGGSGPWRAFPSSYDRSFRTLIQSHGSFFTILSGVFLFGLAAATTSLQINVLTCMASLCTSKFHHFSSFD
jgi:hypothetical protein